MPRWASFAIAAIGCGQPAATQSVRPPPARASPVDAQVAPPPLADDLPRLASRARQLFFDWQTAFADAELDCPTAATRLQALADKNADLIDANRQVLRAGHDKVRALRTELDKLEPELGTIARSIGDSPIMARCARDPAFAQAIDRLAGEG